MFYYNKDLKKLFFIKSDSLDLADIAILKTLFQKVPKFYFIFF